VSDALKTAQRFMFLKNGTLAFDGSGEELMRVNNADVEEFINI
jgi:ABC-type transporter Mla maintaining outer membrane lipid asymmetry ATPase subunit MlaF